MADFAQHDQKPMTIKTDLAKRIEEELGQNVYLCYQCVKCTSGCPVANFFDWQPNQIMRAVQLGQEDIALGSETPWLCASCQTCTTRCPQGLDIAAIMDFLTRESKNRGIKPPLPELNTFNEAFMREVKIWGRSYEPGLMVEMTLRNRNLRALLADSDMYLKMMRKGKVGFFPHPTRMPSKRKVKPIENAENAIAYYPGCSLESTAVEFDESTRAIADALELNLIEPEGWICCGSSPAHKNDPEAAMRFPMENLALIEKSGFKEVTMPCAACFNRHKAALYEIRQHDNLKEKLDGVLGYQFQDNVQVTTLAETIFEHITPAELQEKVQRPLKDLKLVCYYGCLLTRPPQITEAKHPENPTEMDDLMSALGADVKDWSYKTVCCGASHSAVRPDIVLNLSGNIVRHAREAGAEAIVVSCPLCHLNLDARQLQMENGEPMPILYFTQLLALALGLPEKNAMLKKNMVDPIPLLEKYLDQ
jgi:heterodisulfide reductase subunit B